MTEHSDDATESPTEAAAPEQTSELGPTQSGTMGGGASGPRDLPTGGRKASDGDLDPDKAGTTEQTGGSGTGTQGSSNIAGHKVGSPGTELEFAL